MRRSGAGALSVLIASFLACISLSAQQVRLEGDRGDRAVRVLETVLQRSQYRLLDRDTLLDASFHEVGDLVIWDAEVRLEGRVDGDIVVLAGTLHIRPGAVITGQTATIRGLALASTRSNVGALVEMSSSRTALFQRRDESLVVTVVPPRRVALVGTPGVVGLRRASYDRVDGLSVSWGPQLRLTRREYGAAVDLWGTVRTSRSALGGGAELRVPIASGLEIRGRLERATLTPDAWIRGDISNSLIALWGGHDVRDYFESDRAVILLRRTLTQPLIEGEIGFEPFVSFTTSRDRSLTEQAPWAVTGRERLRRENPPVADSLIRSAEVGSQLRWIGTSSELSLTASVEHAPDGWSSLEFTHWRADLGFATAGLWHDLIDVRGHFRGGPGNTSAPPQRWTHVGGPGTLPTLTMATHRGDQMVFLETIYTLPIPYVELPLVGFPALRATFATGTAWRSGTTMPAWDQNLGLGVEASVLLLQAFVDPRADRPRPILQASLQLP